MRMIFAAALLTSAIALPSYASELSVTLDEVQTITFGKPVATVYVGNPSIADINMIDSRHAFILGKGYGTTNIVALNKDGLQISDTHITVLANQRESVVTLNRGASRVTYNCTAAHCEATPEPGDGKDAFGEGNGQNDQHQGIAKKAASSQ